MTFFPDGEVRIPKQTTVPQASPPTSAPDLAEARRRYQHALRRTALINAVVLGTAVVLGYVFPVSDNDNVAFVIVLVAAVLSAAHLSAVALLAIRRQRASVQASTPRTTS